MLYGAIEAGGTKFVCAVGTGPHDVRARTRIETEDPTSTLGSALAFFESHASSLAAVGIASFGPVELRSGHPRYGHITSTPKPGWSNTDIVGIVRDGLGLPVGFDTDVNGAALGEGRWGAGQGLSTFVYLTVGTGVGGGAVVGGRVAHGLVHPEMGHVTPKRLAGDDFAGVCPFHGDCLEGMASGPAFHARWGTQSDQLPEETLEQAVDIEAYYIAAGLRSIVYTLAPERIVLGGGMASLPGLLPSVRAHLMSQLAGYPGLPEHDAEDFVVPAALGGDAGIAGAFALAAEAEQLQGRPAGHC